MNLSTKIILSLSAFVLVALGVWGTVFYYSFMGELTEEMDETLDDYSEDIIIWSLAGEPMPYSDAVAYNTFEIREVTPEYASANNRIRYWESITYIQSQDEDVPARNRTCIFRDAQDRYYELTVSVPTVERDSISEHILKWTVILYAVLLVAIIGIAHSVVRHSLRPLDALLKWFDSYTHGDSPGPMPAETRVVEFRKLSDVAKKAVARLESRNEEQKAFIGNVSHELQTPLSVCTARIEMLLSDPDLTQSQAEQLMKIDRSIRDLSRINKTLLMIHRIENDSFPESEKIDFSVLAVEGIELYSEIYASRNIDASLDVRSGFVFEMNRQLASMLMNNLLKNAFVHGNPGSKVKVDMSSDGFSVSNEGAVPLDRDKIFTRFYRQSSDKDGSTGLGLAIVHSICQSYGLGLEYSWKSGWHIFHISVSFQNRHVLLSSET